MHGPSAAPGASVAPRHQEPAGRDLRVEGVEERVDAAQLSDQLRGSHWAILSNSHRPPLPRACEPMRTTGCMSFVSGLC